MPEFNFTLIVDGDVDARLDDLFEAGCGDATFGAVDGVHYAEFDRDAATFADAVASAISAVESVSGLNVTRIEPDDLVTMSEIAERLGRSRESVRLLVAGERGAGDFPAPVSHLRARNRLWRWADVAAWSGMDTADARQARLVAAINAALKLRQDAAALPEHERSFVIALEHARAS